MDKDIQLAKEVNWLYDRLNKKEMDVLMKWVSENCDTVKEETIKQVLSKIDTTEKDILEFLKELEEGKIYSKIFEYKDEDIAIKKKNLGIVRQAFKIFKRELKKDLIGGAT